MGALIPIAPVLAHGSLGWLWGREIRARIDVIVRSMVHKMMGDLLVWGETWLTWHLGMLHIARDCQSQGACFDRVLVRQARSAWAPFGRP